MANQAEISKNISNLNSSIARLQADREKIAGQEKSVLEKLADELIAGQGDGSSPELTALRERREGLDHALLMAAQKLAGYRADLEHLARAERAGAGMIAWQEISRQLDGIGNKIRALKNDVDQVLVLLDANEPNLAMVDQDTQILSSNMRSFLSTASRELQEMARHSLNGK